MSDLNKKVWTLHDISDELYFGALSVRGHSVALDEEVDICTVDANDLNIEEQVYNASLISFAPDMLELLEKCREQLKVYGESQLVEEIDSVKKDINDPLIFKSR